MNNGLPAITITTTILETFGISPFDSTRIASLLLTTTTIDDEEEFIHKQIQGKILQRVIFKAIKQQQQKPIHVTTKKTTCQPFINISHIPFHQQQHKYGVNAMCMSDCYLISAGRDGITNIFTLPNENIQETFLIASLSLKEKQYHDILLCCAISQHWIATGSYEGVLTLWYILNWQIMTTTTNDSKFQNASSHIIQLQTRILSCQFNDEGNILVCGCHQNIFIYQIHQNGQQPIQIMIIDDTALLCDVRCEMFLKRNNQLWLYFTTKFHDYIYHVNISMNNNKESNKQPKILHDPSFHENIIYSLIYCPSFGIVTCSSDGKLNLHGISSEWNNEKLSIIHSSDRKFNVQTWTMNALGSELIATGTIFGNVRLWSLPSFVIINEIVEAHDGAIRGICFGKDGWIVSCSQGVDDVIRYWR